MKAVINSIIVTPLASGTQFIIQVPDRSVDIDTEKDLQVEIKPLRKRRSLDANAYYWQLVSKIIECYGISQAEYHNRTLAELGYPLRNEDGQIRWHMMPDGDAWLKQLPNEPHYCPTQYTTEIKGKTWRAYYELKPSHMMDKKEMSNLIEYVVQDAKSLGIETMTPAEIDGLKNVWEGKQ